MKLEFEYEYYYDYSEIKIKYLIFIYTKTQKDEIFHCDSHGRIFTAIKQFKNIEENVRSLCKEKFERNERTISWKNEILPLIRQSKLKKLLEDVPEENL